MDSDTFKATNFNLKDILKLSDLNIHRVAEENKRLTVGDYFKMLSQFINVAPDVADAIKKYADDDSGIKNWKVIKDNISLFREMGCDTYISDLNGIKDACERGDHRLAASHASKIIDQDFYNFYTQIMSAKTTSEADSLPSLDSNLLSYLKALEKKEADHELLVLAVDDSPSILEAVSAVLSSEYKVFKLPKPLMLEDILKKMKPDLFLLDYQMPDLNGFECIPIIRSFEEHKETPIVFLTSEGTVDNLTAAVGLGACDFIVKPFNPDQLLEKVAKHIARKK